MERDSYITVNKYIFKYLPINIFTLQTLINNELFFSAPKDFNDPIDSKFKLIVNPEIEGVMNFYNSLNLSHEERNKKIESFKVNKSEFFKDIQTEFNTRLRQESGITSFSEKNDIALMWSHYADKHKGICLMFDWQIHPEYFMGYKVQYGKELPEIIYDGHGQIELGKAMLSKLDHWAYEYEVRSIVKLDNGKNQLATFNPKTLKAIVFGEKVSEIDIKTICNIIAMHPDYRNVEFLKQTSDESGLIKIENF